MHSVTILIPTADRVTSLAATLTSVCSQTYTDFDVIISDQSTQVNPFYDPTIRTLIRLLRKKNHRVYTYTNLPNYGVSQQRHFLLEKSSSSYALFLDDDIILEPFVFRIMVKAIKEEQCGFVGMAPIGLSYVDDIRRDEEHIIFWKEKVSTEIILPNSPEWERHRIHNAANILHIQQKLRIKPKKPKKYKIAWIGACVLYDTKKIKDVGGFTFWKDLPSNHAGEDALVQQRLMKKYGGCGILPSGAYHQELPTTIPHRDYNAPEYLGL